MLAMRVIAAVCNIKQYVCNEAFRYGQLFNVL